MGNWSGFWGDSLSTTGSYDLLVKKSPNNYHLARLFKKRGLRNTSVILKRLLDDATPAGTATLTIAQIDAVATPGSNSQGGVRGVTANQVIDSVIEPAIGSSSPNTARAVTAADVTKLKLILEGGSRAKRAPSTYPTDASGNGGGGKLGR